MNGLLESAIILFVIGFIIGFIKTKSILAGVVIGIATLIPAPIIIASLVILFIFIYNRVDNTSYNHYPDIGKKLL